MRPLDDIVSDDYGYVPGGQGFTEKRAELENGALSACIEDCTPCDSVEELAINAPETLSPGSDAIITISGGKGPFNATLTQKSGQDNGFTLDSPVERQAILSQAANGCGSAEIEITDSCGTIAMAQIRSTSGQWVFMGNTCGAPGPHTSVAGSTFTRISGRYKQEQVYSQTGYFLGTCLYTEPPCGNQGYSCTPPAEYAEPCIDFTLCEYDRLEFPCCWLSPGQIPGIEAYCKSRGALGGTSMRCFASPPDGLKLFEWQC